MKTTLISIVSLLLFSTTVFSQDGFDALKASQYPLKGTARYMSMGGAFTSLGGDPSSITLNPAGLGVYRSSELSATLNLQDNTTSSLWNGQSGSDNNFTAHFNNVSMVTAFNGNNPKFSSAFGVSYERIKSFNRSGIMNGTNQYSSITDYMAGYTNGIPESDLTTANNNDPYNNTNVPWISELAYQGYLINPNTSASTANQWSSLLGNNEHVKPQYAFSESGYVDQYNLSYGVNLNNFVYLGASVGFQELSYTLNSNYVEAFGGGGNMNLQNQIYTSGSGIDVKVGAIVRPTNFLRLGIAYHSPMFYTMTDNYYADLYYNAQYTGTTYTPSDGGYSKYKLQTPSVITVGASGIIGQKGLISFDYEYADYSTMKLRDQNNDAFAFNTENQDISNMMQGVSTYKIGGEYRINKNLAVRLGYNYITPATKSNAVRNLPYNTVRTDPQYFLQGNTQNYAAGLGYASNNWSIDVAYVLMNQHESFYPYNDSWIYSPDNMVHPASFTTKTNNFVMTLGIRF
ncbi:OmpP1/FadL family transporter [Microbacter margulisiae]|uniref:Long-subunit fatty acid transport protein n=1 Tax=Microbacter margulisiae TaxID=1350067 RepID=A0A7W5H0E9_9PORP|nr:outer membrane protein transport protein [Microbacter margulisiae]MBB3186483.1 long-subunit fatty acid transport protein [Microbacter margulisiae]